MSSLTNPCLIRVCVIFSLLLHVIDQATDVFASFLFYIEGDLLSAGLTLAFVFLPGLFIAFSEFRRMLDSGSNIIKVVSYALFSPLWAIIVHGYSLFDARYLQSAMYFKTLEGFLEAGPQMALQLSLLFRGNTPDSSKLILDPIFDFEGSDGVSNVTTLEVFGRVYDQDGRSLFGWIHITSVFFSFLSIFVTTITFNEIESKVHSIKGTLARIAISIPFFFTTLIYRGVGIALCIVLLKYWSGVILFMLFFVNVLSALYIGDEFNRSVCYGFWSLFVPVGYNRDPESHLGYKKIPLFSNASSHESSLSMGMSHGAPERQDSLTLKDIQRSQGRARYFLTAHLLSSLLILGASLLFLIIFVQVRGHEFDLVVAFDLNHLNTLFLPLLGLNLGLSILFARPYHRCECSGGETPEGNVIV